MQIVSPFAVLAEFFYGTLSDVMVRGYFMTRLVTSSEILLLGNAEETIKTGEFMYNPYG